MTKDWYRRMMAGMLPISFLFLIVMLGLNPEAMFFSDWFLNFLIIPNFFAAHLSASAYVGRAVDACAPQPVAGFKERVGTWLGVAAGLAVGITLCVLKVAMPFGGIIGAASGALYTLGSISAISGFTNRVGNTLDNNGRANNEKRAISIGLVLGLAAGLALFFTKSVALITIVGATTFFTGGLALPFILGGIIFAVSVGGTCASCADYMAKAWNYKNSEITQDATIKKTVKERFYEYRGANWGVSTGLVVAGVIILALAVAQPYLFAGIIAIATIAAITVCCVSVFGGLFSRLGRLKDGYELKKKQDAEMREALLPKNDPQLENRSDHQHDKTLVASLAKGDSAVKASEISKETQKIDSSASKGLVGKLGVFGSYSPSANSTALTPAVAAENIRPVSVACG